MQGIPGCSLNYAVHDRQSVERWGRGRERVQGRGEESKHLRYLHHLGVHSYFFCAARFKRGGGFALLDYIVEYRKSAVSFSKS